MNAFSIAWGITCLLTITSVVFRLVLINMKRTNLRFYKAKYNVTTSSSVACLSKTIKQCDWLAVTHVSLTNSAWKEFLRNATDQPSHVGEPLHSAQKINFKEGP